MSKATEGKDEMDLDAVAEQELTRLQQHYRIIESNQGNISDKAKLLLNKQRYVINSLLNEKREIMMQLQVASSKRYEEKDNEDNARLSTLMEEKQSENLELTVRDDVVSQSILLHRADRIGAYMNSTSGDRQLTQHESVIGCLSRRREIQMNCLEYIKTEKAQLKELEAQIRKVDKEVTKLKASQETDANVLDKAAAKERNIRLLEGRLHNETVKFNQQVAKNWQLRNEINHLLNDRARFNQIYQALIGKLNHNKKVMMDLVEQATHAYDQREESQNKLALLRERGRLDLVTQSAEMRELKRRFDHDSKLQEFLAVKGQRRLMVDLEQKEATRKRLHREATERQLQHYRETLEKICEFSGETDIDRLSAQFIKQEEENFALFNYVYELNNEASSLEKEESREQTYYTAQQN